MSASTISVISASRLVSASQPNVAWLGGVAQQHLDLRRPEQRRVDDQVVVHLQADMLERDLAHVPHRRGPAGRDHVVVRAILLQHQPHRLHVVPGVAPVALGVDVAEPQLLLLPSLIRATASVTLRVTNSTPRSGLSWLNRMPFEREPRSSRGS